MPFAWTAIYLMNIVTGATGGQDAVKTCEPEPSRSSSLGVYIRIFFCGLVVLLPLYSCEIYGSVFIVDRRSMWSLCIIISDVWVMGGLYCRQEIYVWYSRSV